MARLTWFVAVVIGYGLTGCQTDPTAIVAHHGSPGTAATAKQQPHHGALPELTMEKAETQASTQRTGNGKSGSEQTTDSWRQNGQTLPGMHHPPEAPEEPLALTQTQTQKQWASGSQQSQAWSKSTGALSPQRFKKPLRRWGCNRWQRSQTSQTPVMWPTSSRPPVASSEHWARRSSNWSRRKPTCKSNWHKWWRPRSNSWTGYRPATKTWKKSPSSMRRLSSYPRGRTPTWTYRNAQTSPQTIQRSKANWTPSINWSPSWATRSPQMTSRGCSTQWSGSWKMQGKRGERPPFSQSLSQRQAPHQATQMPTWSLAHSQGSSHSCPPVANLPTTTAQAKELQIFFANITRWSDKAQ